MTSRPRIAVAGTGIAGMAAAWLLSRHYDVTVYEKNDYIGGHSHTVEVKFPTHSVPVDTGFIVFNDHTYPHLLKLFGYLNVPVQKSSMSFGVSIENGRIEYASATLNTVFAQRKNLFDPCFLRMLADIIRFNRAATKLLHQPEAPLTLAQFLEQQRMSSYFRHAYMLPMVGAIWSCPMKTVMEFPAHTFARFFYDHGLLTLTGQPQWYTVTGGSREYVKRLTAPFAQHIRLSCGIRTLRRVENGVEVTDKKGDAERYEQIVIAAHADEALAMLGDATPRERKLLGAFRYQRNRAVLHGDSGLMPENRNAWASWVYRADKLQDETPGLCATYWMNRLQSIAEETPLFVSLNPPCNLAPVYGEFMYDHPVYDLDAIQAQKQLGDIQGVNRTWFCGSYHRYGFHEDALSSAISTANGLGVKAPWQ